MQPTNNNLQKDKEEQNKKDNKNDNNNNKNDNKNDNNNNNINNQQQMFFIDSHTHLLDYERQSHLQLDKILKQSLKYNVRYIAANTCCTNQFKEMQVLYTKQIQQLKQSNMQQKQQSNMQQKQQSNMQQSMQQSIQQKQSKSQITIIPCFGIHPCYICQQLKKQLTQQEQLKKQQQNNNINDNKDWQQLLKHYLLNNPTSHVGQIGLDFRKDVLQTNPQDKQWQFFQQQFQIAIELKRSVTIHCVRAYGQLLKFLKKQNMKQKERQKLKQKNIQTKYQQQKKQNIQINSQLQQRPIIILHSYGGSKQITKSLNKLQHLSIYFSLSLKHSRDILEVIPIEKLIVQTDAPYQNDSKLIVENGLWTEEEVVKQQIEFNQSIKQGVNNILSNQPKGLLKQCKFFNKSILNNRPMNVVANYKQLAKSYKLDLNTFTQKVTLNALKAFKLLK